MQQFEAGGNFVYETKERNFLFTTPESARRLLVDAMKLLIEIIRLITMNWEGKEAGRLVLS
jgi:hypothetical protein